MKYYIIAIIAVFTFACNNTTTKEKETKETEKEVAKTASKELNYIIEDTVDGGLMLLGRATKDALEKEPFNEWYTENYEQHTLDTNAISNLKTLLEGVKIKVFMGTWCEDSQREVPALFKILEATKFNLQNLELITVTHDKNTPQEYEKNLDINYVPTLIFYKNGEELNRVVEYPIQSLEKDMITILQNEPYQHTYAE